MTQTNPEQWAVDVRYLAKLADWAAGEGFCKIEALTDPDEWCIDAYDRAYPGKDGEGYSADTLAAGLVASIQAAFAEREARLVGAMKWAGEVSPPVNHLGCVTVDMSLDELNAMRVLAGFKPLPARKDRTQ